jgi:2-methylcitrate dehydratase PrpD
MTAAATLGRFVFESDWSTITPALRREGQRSLLNSVGCALGVARSPAVEMAVRALLPLSGRDGTTVIGRPERLDIMGAAFVNAIGANLLDYDDTHLRTVIHPSAPVMPAVFALAERHGFSGAAVLHAFILGVEVACRIGNAVSPIGSPGHYARGWHITSTCGVFGAAAASAKLLGLSAEQTGHAIGLASSQSAGNVENLASAGKNISVGNAAKEGILATLLAREGYTAAPAALEGPLGWARAMGDVPDVQEITGDLGQRWEALRNTYKPYPAGIVMHAVIDACLALRADLGGVGIAEVTVSGDQLLLDRGDRPTTNERDARVSIPHCAAAPLVRGAAGLREFSAEGVSDPAIAALRGRVRVALDAASPRGAARVVVRTEDGRVLEKTVLHAKGSETAPLSDADLAAKLRDSAAEGGFTGDTAAIITALERIADAPNLGPLMALLRV